MRKPCLALPLVAGLLLSCTTAPKVDPLEAKASEGDPAAACQLVVRSLHECALEKRKWEVGETTSRPACVDQGVSKRQQDYLDKATKSLEKHQTGQLLFLADQIQLITVALPLQAGPADKVIDTIDELQQTCANIAKYSKP